jgi:Tol biopolymer transport system component
MPLLSGVIACAGLLSAAWASTPSEHLVLRQASSHVNHGNPGGAIAADGRFIAVVSEHRLLPADGNSLPDIYVLDRDTYKLTLETLSADGKASNGSTFEPQFSADGQYLVFASHATNLTSLPDRNESEDVFVRDRVAGTTRRVSIGFTGHEANGKSTVPAISGDGKVVAFVSYATNLVPGEDANGGDADIYLVRLATGEITRVSLDGGARQLAAANSPSLDRDGRLLAFAAKPAPSTSGGSGTRRVYVRDLVSRSTTCISCGQDGTRDGLAAFAPVISADGNTVVFVVNSTPQRSDIAVHDRDSSRTTVITREANARSAGPRVSGDGRIVVFESWASDLLCGRRCSDQDLDENVLPDVYLFDATARRFARVSGAGRTWWAPSRAPAVDGRGRTVVFSSRQPFGPEDVTVDFDLFVCTPTCR